MERQSNLELLRIIAMIMVITVHYVGHGRVLDNVEVFSLNFYVSNLMQAFTTFSVPIYVMISAYFMCEKEFKLKRVFKIWLQVFFYSISIYLLTLVLGLNEFSMLQFIKNILPIICNQYSFVTAYIMLLILSPFLNKVIEVFDKGLYEKLVITLIIMFFVLGAGLPINVITCSYLSLLVVIYLITAYIKKYYKLNIKKEYYFFIFLASVMTIFIGRILMYKVGLGFESSIFFAYNNLFVFIGTVSLFMFFSQLYIKSKLINKIAKLTFGIYLIHDNNYVREILYDKILHVDKWIDSNVFIIVAIISIGLIFISCGIIELCRSKIFEGFRVNDLMCGLIVKIKSKINYLIKKIVM